MPSKGHAKSDDQIFLNLKMSYSMHNFPYSKPGESLLSPDDFCKIYAINFYFMIYMIFKLGNKRVENSNYV